MCFLDVALCKSSPKSSTAAVVICCFGAVVPRVKGDDPWIPPNGPVFGKGSDDAFTPPSIKGENECVAVAVGAISAPAPICVRGAGIFNPARRETSTSTTHYSCSKSGLILFLFFFFFSLCYYSCIPATNGEKEMMTSAAARVETTSMRSKGRCIRVQILLRFRHRATENSTCIRNRTSISECVTSISRGRRWRTAKRRIVVRCSSVGIRSSTSSQNGSGVRIHFHHQKSLL